MRAPLFDKSTLLVSRPAAVAVGHLDTLVSDLIFQREVTAAHGTVHSAGRDQVWFHQENSNTIEEKETRIILNERLKSLLISFAKGKERLTGVSFPRNAKNTIL